MAMAKTHLSLLAGVLLLGGCAGVPSGAYFNRGDPETLLDKTSETIQVSLLSGSSVQDLESILHDDPPSRAELNCSASESLCSRAARALSKQQIPLTYAQSMEHGERSVALVYERTVARDCENRYIDNTSNVYNLNPPTFGCSVTANSVQMVTDKHQFTQPKLKDYMDAEKTVQAYGKYTAPAKENQGGTSESLLSGVSSSQ